MKTEQSVPGKINNDIRNKNKKRTIVLGLHREPWHDTGATLIVEDDSEVKIVSISQERIDRIKHSRSYPKEAIEYCLNELNVSSVEEIDLVVSDYLKFPVWNRDFNSNVRKGYHPILNGPRDSDTNNHFYFPPEKIALINHHQAHAAAAFYASGFEESAVLVVDGNGSEMETQSLFFASRKDGITLIEKSFALGLGQLYSSITKAIGFGTLNEGKTMGLAPFGDTKTENQKDIIDWSLAEYCGINTDYSKICDWYYEVLVPLPQIDDSVKARLAYEVQREVEKGMVHLAKHAKKVTKSSNLCISGGVGLNSISNYEILRNGIFKNLFIQPACSDTGIPLGCAYHGYHQILKRQEAVNFNYALLGKNYHDIDIYRAIRNYTGFEIINQNIFDKTVDLLLQNKVVGWFQGRSETGPRALGSRSILMNPCRAENKDILNAQVKHREAFRPFAPAVIEEKLNDYFVLDEPSPYMLLIADVKKEAQDLIPAVTHVDGTARVQTVTKESNEKFYNMIQKFGERSGVYVLLNTSFNDNNEPIVETPEDAIRCFMNTGIDALCVGDYLLVKNSEAVKSDIDNSIIGIVDNNLTIEYAEQLIQNKDYKQARIILNELLRTDVSQNLKILNDLAVIDILEEKLDAGISIIKKVLDSDPQNEIAKSNLDYIMELKA